MAKRKAVASDDEDEEDLVPEKSRSATPDEPVKDKPKVSRPWCAAKHGTVVSPVTIMFRQ